MRQEEAAKRDYWKTLRAAGFTDYDFARPIDGETRSSSSTIETPSATTGRQRADQVKAVGSPAMAAVPPDVPEPEADELPYTLGKWSVYTHYKCNVGNCEWNTLNGEDAYWQHYDQEHRPLIRSSDFAHADAPAKCRFCGRYFPRAAILCSIPICLYCTKLDRRLKEEAIQQERERHIRIATIDYAVAAVWKQATKDTKACPDCGRPPDNGNPDRLNTTIGIDGRCMRCTVNRLRDEQDAAARPAVDVHGIPEVAWSRARCGACLQDKGALVSEEMVINDVPTRVCMDCWHLMKEHPGMPLTIAGIANGYKTRTLQMNESLKYSTAHSATRPRSSNTSEVTPPSPAAPPKTRRRGRPKGSRHHVYIRNNYARTYAEWLHETGEHPRQVDVAQKLGGYSERTFQRAIMGLPWPPQIAE